MLSWLHRIRRRLEAALEAGCEFSRDCRGVLVCEPKKQFRRPRACFRAAFGILMDTKAPWIAGDDPPRSHP
jgi:hypothetical protein